MNKTEMISLVAGKTNLGKPQVEAVINATLETVIAQLQKGQEVTFAGFGTFMAKSRHARMGVNPLNPKERIQMPATVVPKFKSGKTLKDSLKPKKESSAPAAPAAPAA